jgi:hypothetical protein
VGEEVRHKLKKTVNRVVLGLVKRWVVREVMLGQSVGRGKVGRINFFHIVM